MLATDDLNKRFGHPDHYEELFLTMDQNNLREDFAQLSLNRGKYADNCEITRQHFLKLLGQHQMVWYPTDSESDMEVEISRICKQDQQEYLAFMRVLSHGFRSERITPSGIQMVFHVLTGRVVFHYKKKSRTLSRGHYITVAPKSTYSLRSVDEDQTAYLIFRVYRVKKTRTKIKTKTKTKTRSSSNENTTIQENILIQID